MRLFKNAIALILSLNAGACVGVGPNSIVAGRNFYNEVITSTANEQLLLNIARVSQQETAQFLDIPEVDATVTLTANPQGGVASIGAIAGFFGSAMGSVTYTESPIIKYLPLAGNALIEQIGTPLRGRSVARLTTSDWPFYGILEYSIDTLTPAFLDNYRAFDLLTALDAQGAISLEVDPKDDDKLVIRFNSDGTVGSQLLQSVDKTDTTLQCLSQYSDAHAAKQRWNLLGQLLGRKLDNELIMYTNKRVSREDLTIKTRSALGALKQAESHLVAIIDPKIADSVRYANQNATCSTGQYYYLADNTRLNTRDEIEDLWNRSASYIKNDVSSSDARNTGFYIGHKRALIIVERASYPPENSYVSVYHDGQWWSINKFDTISKKYFSLLNQILTLQAIQDATKLTPTVLNAR